MSPVSDAHVPSYAVIADDLTGAADTGVQFAAEGLATALDLRGTDEPISADVLVVTTDSRGLPSNDAAERVSTVTRQLHGQGVHQLYKKIDSTCRGNLAAEIAAVLAESERRTLAVVCPAFIAARRTVVGGHLLVDREPVDRTPVGDDPVSPVTTSSILAMLAPLPGQVEHLDLCVVTEGADVIRRALDEVDDDTIAVVVDAASEADLAALGDALDGSDRPILPVGSAGLARALAPLWARNAPAAAADGLTLVVVGSVHETSRTQSDVLAERHGWPRLTLDLDAMIGDQAAWTHRLEELQEQAGDLSQGRPGLLLTTPARQSSREEQRQLAEDHGMELGQVAATVADRLAEATVALCQTLPIEALVLTGGDTARAIATQLGAAGISLTGEVVPGMPVGRLLGGELDGRPVVTKAGGFGDDDGLLLATRHIQQIDRDRHLDPEPAPRT
jgi:D-threonate/D-erythronate kinase